jgi:hypothetical protein
MVEYLRECKTVLAHEPGYPGVQFNKKTKGQKSCETVPLKHVPSDWKVVAKTVHLLSYVTQPTAWIETFF